MGERENSVSSKISSIFRSNDQSKKKKKKKEKKRKPSGSSTLSKFLSFGSKKDEIPDASNDEYDTHDEEQPLSPNNYDDDSENMHVDFADEEYYHDAEEEEES